MTGSNYVRAIVVVLALFWTPLPAHAADAEIEHFTLRNGMEVVLVPSHRVPAVTHMIWYKVGAADDYPGRSGLAHYNEHMMFQGTEKQAGGEFARIVASHGGRTNAFTSRDYTGYYVSIAREHLPLVMAMEADRMLHLAPTKENFAKEREVIIEERRMSIENEPSPLMSEELHALLYRNHPYHNPIIGWMHEMLSLTREDVLAFHREFYHPANAVLVVVGDITRKELEPMANRYYGSLPAGAPYARHWRTEPPARGPRHLEMHHAQVREPELVRIYAAPGLDADQKNLVLPSFLLSQILGGGSTSRLYQALVVRDKIATSIDTDYDGISRGPGEFQIHATPADGVTLQQLEAALDKELAAFARSPGLTADELARAKTLMKADTIYSRDGMESMARILGVIIMAGLPADYFTHWPQYIDEVSLTDITKAASVIFNPDQSVTGYLEPQRPAASAEAK